MPFALMTIGLLLVIAAYNNSGSALASQLKSDFTGSGNFLYWIAAIFIVGLIGYAAPMRGVSRAALALVIVVLFLQNKGFFSQFNSALSGSSSGTDASKTATTGNESDTSSATKTPTNPMATPLPGSTLLPPSAWSMTPQ